MTKWTTFGLLLLVMQTANALEKAKPRPKETKVSVSLSFSVAEYDPTKPSKAVMKCVVRNNTDKAIQVPVGYDGNRIQLESTWDKDGTQRPVLNYINKDPYIKKDKADLKRVRIGPGKHQVVFEFPLDEILLRGRTKKGSLGWDWPEWTRRTAPPRSPIFRKAGGRDVLVGQASFAVRLKIGFQTVTSNNARLKVKLSD